MSRKRKLDNNTQKTNNMMEWATIDLENWNGKKPQILHNLVNGKWTKSKKYLTIPDPMNGEGFVEMPNTQPEELNEFIQSLNSCPKYGMHNPLYNPQRYRMYADISFKVGGMLEQQEVADYFSRIIMRLCPKSYQQAMGEVIITRNCLKSYGGDQVRFLARSVTAPGDHQGQQTTGYRWPFGPVAVIGPFNFPLEIPALQLMGALFMGNKPTIKSASTVSACIEEFIRLLIHCGMPPTDVDLLHCGGRVMGEFLKRAQPKNLQFTGSADVAEDLAVLLHGKVKLEDAGFDWKILGPDVDDVEYVGWVCDQDAYACSGQKCSAQSILFVHENWVKTDLFKIMEKQCSKRNLKDLTIGPVLSEPTEKMLNHIKKVLAIPGSKVMWGGKPLVPEKYPGCEKIHKKYGILEPTAIYVPLKELIKPDNFELCTIEIFGPYQIVTHYNDNELEMVLGACEKMKQHLTAACVSNNYRFVNKVMSRSVNGTTYHGIRARTTGAPANHWFGPSGDPRGAGIGSPEAIKYTWSAHRCIIADGGEIPENWKMPLPT